MSASFENNVMHTTATIATGAALSGEVHLRGSSTLAISMPSAWTTAAITFQVAEDSAANGGMYKDAYDDAGVEITVPSTAALANRVISLQAIAQKLAPFEHIKIRSGTTGTPVNQTAGATITVIGKS